MPTRTCPRRRLLPAVIAAAALAPVAALALVAAVAGGGNHESGFWGAGGVALRALAGPTTAGGSEGGGRTYRVAVGTSEREIELPAGVEIEELFALRQGAFVSARGPVRPGIRGASKQRDLFLAQIDSQGLHPLPVPAPTPDRLRENAVPLASPNGDLEGLVWLEGPDRQSYVVQYAAWETLRWGEPMVVAREAPGSQLALAAATLGDGSKLLVWSRFDGSDDEIVAAHFVEGRWSAARPLADDNTVPDITPSVIAVPGGALATWSRYDGHDYRVVISRFDGRDWSPPSWAGPAGSTEPFLTPAAARAVAGSTSWLTYSGAQPPAWNVLELDASGRVLRRGSVTNVPRARPALEPLPSGGVRLLWAARASDVELH